MKQLTWKCFPTSLLRNRCVTALAVASFLSIINSAQADDGKTKVDLRQVDVSADKITPIHLPKVKKNVDSCVSRALKLRHLASSKMGVENTPSNIKVKDVGMAPAALLECIDCGQPCVINGTPCCPGTEDDHCWGVCEGQFPNTYCQ